MMTNRQRDMVNALLDQAATGQRGTLNDLAKRLGVVSRSNAHKLIAGLVARGFIRRNTPVPMFHARCFKAFKWNCEADAFERYGLN